MFIRKIKEVIKKDNPYYNFKPQAIRIIDFTITDENIFDPILNKVNLDFWEVGTYVITNIEYGINTVIKGTSNGSKFKDIYEETLKKGIKGIEFAVNNIGSFDTFGDQNQFIHTTIYEDLPEWIVCDNCESRYKSEYIGKEVDYYDFDEKLCPCCGTEIYEYEVNTIST